MFLWRVLRILFGLGWWRRNDTGIDSTPSSVSLLPFSTLPEGTQLLSVQRPDEATVITALSARSAPLGYDAVQTKNAVMSHIIPRLLMTPQLCPSDLGLPYVLFQKHRSGGTYLVRPRHPPLVCW